MTRTRGGTARKRAKSSAGSVELENELQPELENPWIARTRIGPGDPAEGRLVIDRRVRNVEVYLVEEVEELHARLHVRRGVEAEVLRQPHVPAVQRRTVIRAFPDVAERAEVVGRKGRGVEIPHAIEASRGRNGVHVRAGQLRAIVAAAVARVVGAAGDVDRTARLILHDARPLPAAKHEADRSREVLPWQVH